jgi:hypothetical protein
VAGHPTRHASVPQLFDGHHGPPEGVCIPRNRRGTYDHSHSTPQRRPEREHRNVEKELQELTARFAGKENALAVPLNFAMTVEPHRSSVDPRTERPTCTASFLWCPAYSAALISCSMAARCRGRQVCRESSDRGVLGACRPAQQLNSLIFDFFVLLSATLRSRWTPTTASTPARRACSTPFRRYLPIQPPNVSRCPRADPRLVTHADASAAPAGRGGPTASRGGGGRNKRLR